MRARSIIRMMEDGDRNGWRLARRKITDPRVHEVNKEALLKAMDTLISAETRFVLVDVDWSKRSEPMTATDLRAVLHREGLTAPAADDMPIGEVIDMVTSVNADSVTIETA